MKVTYSLNLRNSRKMALGLFEGKLQYFSYTNSNTAIVKKDVHYILFGKGKFLFKTRKIDIYIELHYVFYKIMHSADSKDHYLKPSTVKSSEISNSSLASF